MNLVMMILMALAVLVIGWLVVKTLKWAREDSRPTMASHGPRTKSIKRHWRKVYLMPLLIHRLTGWWPGARVAQYEVQFANIGQGGYEHGKRGYIPDGATTVRYLLYKRGTDADHCAVCGAGDDPLGPSDDLADANNLDLPIAIQLLGAVKGSVFVVTDGTLADGDYCKAGANGKVTKASTTNLSFGRALIPTDSTKADGDVISMIPALPAKYVF